MSIFDKMPPVVKKPLDKEGETGGYVVPREVFGPYMNTMKLYADADDKQEVEEAEDDENVLRPD